MRQLKMCLEMNASSQKHIPTGRNELVLNSQTGTDSSEGPELPFLNAAKHKRCSSTCPAGTAACTIHRLTVVYLPCSEVVLPWLETDEAVCPL